MIFTTYFKNYISNISFFSIIIYKFSNWQKFYKIILLKVNKDLELYFYYTILILDFSISLRIKNSEKLILDSKKVLE